MSANAFPLVSDLLEQPEGGARQVFECGSCGIRWANDAEGKFSVVEKCHVCGKAGAYVATIDRSSRRSADEATRDALAALYHRTDGTRLTLAEAQELVQAFGSFVYQAHEVLVVCPCCSIPAAWTYPPSPRLAAHVIAFHAVVTAGAPRIVPRSDLVAPALLRDLGRGSSPRPLSLNPPPNT